MKSCILCLLRIYFPRPYVNYPYDECVSKAESVHKRIRDVETVSADMFAEWEKEIQEISTPSLRDSSKQQLAATRLKYRELHSVLLSAEKSMDPVLKQFNDYVLYLKHNLNAQAIASLKGESYRSRVAHFCELM